MALMPVTSRAVILYDTGDPNVNITAPSGSLSGSGWQFEGHWGLVLGTPIAPHYFISAAHVGNAGGGIFRYNETNYTATQSFSLGGSDLLIWKVNETFPSVAPLYTTDNEAGKHLVVIGRGTQRGSAVMLNNTLRGWSWGTGDHVQRWGENDVAQLVPDNGHQLIYATFDQPTQISPLPNESHLSTGDSGGAVFIKDASDGVWKLAGINYAVDDLYTAADPNTRFNAAIFDSRGYYNSDGKNPPTFTPVTGDAAVPTGFYSSDIASELAWIAGVIAEPTVTYTGNSLVLTYDRIIAPSSDIVYTVDQSTDLVSWQSATTQDQVVASNGDIETVSSTVDVTGVTVLFLRLNITRPPSQSVINPQNTSTLRPIILDQ